MLSWAKLVRGRMGAERGSKEQRVPQRAAAPPKEPLACPYPQVLPHPHPVSLSSLSTPKAENAPPPPCACRVRRESMEADRTTGRTLEKDRRKDGE